ncbi:MAG: TRAP transporter large permease [Candidatus Thorarchaeota archaeon]
MIDLSPELATVILGLGILIAILLGYPLVFSLGSVALLVGAFAFGPGLPQLFYSRIFGVVSDYIFLAVPLFVFMGVMIEQSGIAERLFSAFYLWLGGLRGGLAIVTIIIGTILAASVGVVTASVVMIGLLALPAMVRRGYDRSLASGAVCAGGTLGILIPPSIMLVVYGPTASISVGKLFMAAFIPGLLLSVLYIVYIGVRALVDVNVGPPMPIEERAVPFTTKLRALLVSIVPPIVLILSVLGSIFFGIASPTEAAAVGALVSVIMAFGYGALNPTSFKGAVYETMRITGLVMAIAMGGSMFSGVFLGLGCGDVIADAILAAPGGAWGGFILIMLLIYVLGMFIDWVGIIFIMVPVITPISATLGFDPLWFAMMVIVNLQMSFLSPPFCPTVFVLQGIVKPEWGITMADIMKGVLPFLGMIAIALVLCVWFPQIILWLPNQMIR